MLIAIYALCGFLWVPKLIRNAAIGYVSNSLHRQLSLGQVRFNPFTLTAQVTMPSSPKRTAQPSSALIT